MSVAETANEIFAANRAVGQVVLAVKSTAAITRRARVHEEGSLRVRFPGRPGRELEAILVNTAGGMAGGDRFEIDITVGEDARLAVTTTAAEKIYRTLGPDTAIDVTMRVGTGGELAWLPQETILFDQARLNRTIEVDLAADAKLVIAEAVVFGRTGMGEAVRMGRYFDRWRVRRGGKLIYAEAFRLDDDMAEKLAMPAVANGSAAVATVLVVPGNDATANGAVVNAVRALPFGGEAGASAWNGIAVIRLVAAGDAAMRSDLAAVLKTIRAFPRPLLN
jgi:urease accessory protein